MPRDPDRPIQLTRWIHGRVRIHFRSGHTAELAMSLRTAHSLRKQLDEKQGADSIGGLHAHSGWLWARHDEIVLTEWEPAVDYGWPDVPDEERPRLEELGMPHGVLAALAELWESKHRHRAAYSINAVAALHTIATKESNVTRDVWDRMAQLLEGENGARLARPEIYQRTRPMAGRSNADRPPEDPDGLTDDESEPTDTSSESDGTAPEPENVEVTQELEGSNGPTTEGNVGRAPDDETLLRWLGRVPLRARTILVT